MAAYTTPNELQQKIQALEKENAELRREKNKYRQFLENLNDIVYCLDASAIVTYVSPNVEKIAGYRPEEIVGRSYSDFLHPDDMENQGTNFRKVLTGENVATEHRLVTRSGGTARVMTNAGPIVENGAVVGVQGVLVDITRRKKEQERYRLIIENAGDLICTLDENGFLQYISPNSRYILGYPPENFIGSHFQSFIHPDDVNEIIQTLSEIFEEYRQSGESNVNQRIVECRALTREGRWKWLSAKNTILKEQNSKYELAIIARDITDQKEIENRLRESEEEYRNLFENAPVGIFRADDRGRGWLANSTMARILGFPTTRAAMDYYNDLSTQLYTDPQRRARFLQLIRDQGFVENFEFEAQTFDGRKVWLSMNARLVNPDSRGAFFIEGFTTDITSRKQAEEEKKRLEEQFHQAQKLESVGRLAGGVAHDLNNLLAPILGYSELLLEGMSGSDTSRKPLEEIANAGTRARALVGQLLAFSRKQALQFQLIDMNQLLKDFENLLRRALREDIAIDWHPAGALPKVQGDPGQLEQVVMNLAVNAQDAMPDGGRLIIETSLVELDETYAGEKRGVVPGAYVMLAISDTGTGMDAGTMEHLFEPFFTTKGKEKGTGLGLATSYGIVKQHGGNIWAYSEPGMGTTFRVYLPIAGETGNASPVLYPLSQKPKQGSETILIVEDDPQVKTLTATMLQKMGYTVLSAGNGQEALTVLQAHESRVHLLLTDVIMPNMNGRKVYEQAARIFPEIKALYMSGYTDDVIAHHGVIDPDVDFIQKPFSAKALAAKVREVLDQ